MYCVSKALSKDKLKSCEKRVEEILFLMRKNCKEYLPSEFTSVREFPATFFGNTTIKENQSLINLKQQSNISKIYWQLCAQCKRTTVLELFYALRLLQSKETRGQCRSHGFNDCMERFCVALKWSLRYKIKYRCPLRREIEMIV